MQSRPQLASGLLTLSQCCFLTCKPLACPRSMQVCRYSSQKSTEQPKCKELQRTLHPIRPHQTQSNLEVRRCRVSVLNRINSTLPLSFFFKNHTRLYTNSLRGFFLKPAAGFNGVPPLPPTSGFRAPGGDQKWMKER